MESDLVELCMQHPQNLLNMVLCDPVRRRMYGVDRMRIKKPPPRRFCVSPLRPLLLAASATSSLSFIDVKARDIRGDFRLLHKDDCQCQRSS